MVHKLDQAIAETGAGPAVRGKLEAMGVELVAITPAELLALTWSETEHWAPFVKAIGLKVE